MGDVPSVFRHPWLLTRKTLWFLKEEYQSVELVWEFG
jgi:hypothetical protein